MRRSKLESYEVILEALVRNPLKLENLAFETSTDCKLLQRNVDFLMGNQLIEERVEDMQLLYAITDRGIAVLRALNFQKYLGKIKNTIRAIDEAMEAIPDIAERTNGSQRKVY